MRKKFGELLLEQGLITQAQLADALTYQRRTGMRLGAALVAKGHIDEQQLVNALGAALRVPVVRLDELQADPAALTKVSLEMCSQHDLLPYALRRERGRVVLTVATSDPLNFRLLDELEFMTGSKVEAVLAPASDIDKAIRKYYGPRLGRPYQMEEVVMALQEESSPGMTILRRGGGEERVNTNTGLTADLLENAPVSLPPEAKDQSTEVSAVLLTDEVLDETPVDPDQTPIPLTEVKARGPTPTGSSPPSGDQLAPTMRPGPAANYPDALLRGPASLDAHPPPVSRATPPSGHFAPPVSRATPAAGRPAPVGRPTPVAGVSAPAQWPPPAPSTLPTQAPVAPAAYGGGAHPISPGDGFDSALGDLIDAASDADHVEAVLRLERKFWALMRVLAKKGLLTNQDFLQELGEEEKWRR